jgi:hypothetical protein
MLSARLLQSIDSNRDEITERFVRAVQRDPNMPNLAARPAMELHEWCRDALESLSRAVTGTRRADWRERFEASGQAHFEEKIPLHEGVQQIHELKNRIFGFLAEQALPSTAVNLYAEEQLELRLVRFFDAMVYRLVLGYEQAQRVAARLTAGHGSGAL